MKKFVLLLLVIVAGAFFFVAYNFLSLDDTCENVVLSESANPNRQIKAVIFQRDCGATTGFSTQVSILEFRDELKNDGGNVFVADTNHGEAPSDENGGPKVEAEWISSNNLKLSYHPKARTFTKITSFNDIQITYEEIEN